MFLRDLMALSRSSNLFNAKVESFLVEVEACSNSRTFVFIYPACDDGLFFLEGTSLR